MPDLDDRLKRCFSAVFPSVSAEDIPGASFESVKEWDSLATIRLVGVLEEEFEIRVDLSELGELSSFGNVREFLLKRLAES